jgi:acyl carrier protein
MPEVLAGLERIIREVFVAPDVEVSRDTTADDVPGWDSLGHVRLLLTVEKFFAIKFPPLEARTLKNVGELADLVARKLGAG